MQIIREIRKIYSDRIEIAVPQRVLGRKEVEILVFPLQNSKEEVHPKKKLQLTQYKCYGKKKIFPGTTLMTTGYKKVFLDTNVLIYQNV